MYDWETRLTSVDNNRVVRPLDWGLDWTQAGRDEMAVLADSASSDLTAILLALQRSHHPATATIFTPTSTPTDFRLEKREVQVFSTREVPDPKLEEKVRGTNAEFLRFTSPVATPYPENNLVNARWFPARGTPRRRSLPHWNADGIAYNSLCRVFNWHGYRGAAAEHAVSRHSPSGGDSTAPIMPSQPILDARLIQCGRESLTCVAASTGWKRRVTTGSEL